MAWENSSVVVAVAAAVAHLGCDRIGFDIIGFDRIGFDRIGFDRIGFDRIGFDRIGFDRIGFDRIGFDIIARFQKKCCFFAPKMNQELIKVPCFQKNADFSPK